MLHGRWRALGLVVDNRSHREVMVITEFRAMLVVLVHVCCHGDEVEPVGMSDSQALLVHLPRHPETEGDIVCA